MKDYRVKITIRNDRLLSAIESMGFVSVAQFCKKFELEYQRTTEIINGKLKPLDDKGSLRKTCDQLLAILGLELHEAFTDRQLQGFSKRTFETKVEESELKQMIAPVKNQEVKMIEQDVSKKINQILSRYLGPRAERVLRMRFGIGMMSSHTYEEIALDLGLTRERVRQIEQKAIKTLSNKKECLRELASTGFYEVFQGIDTSMLVDDKLKDDVDFESKLEDVKNSHKKIVLDTYDMHLQDLEKKFSLQHDNLQRIKDRFINKFKENFKKIKKKSVSDEFEIQFFGNSKGLQWIEKQLSNIINELIMRDNLSGIEEVKNKKNIERANTLYAKALKRKAAFLKMSEIDDNGNIMKISNWRQRKIIVKGVYYK